MILDSNRGLTGELKTLYQSAAALVFPSLYEGLGPPLLEAMACGCPVFSADILSSREECAKAACYFDPCLVDELEEKMTEILEQPDMTTNLYTKGFIRCSYFLRGKQIQILLINHTLSKLGFSKSKPNNHLLN